MLWPLDLCAFLFQTHQMKKSSICLQERRATQSQRIQSNYGFCVKTIFFEKSIVQGQGWDWAESNCNLLWRQYIQSMNNSNTAEEETKTTKYLNNCNQNSSEKDLPSESLTEKPNPTPNPSRSSKHSKQTPDRPPPLRKNNNNQMQYKSKNQQMQSNNRLEMNGHKKGKSMDLQQFLSNSKKDKKVNAQNQVTKEKYKKYSSNQINPCFKDRNSMSEMKSYNEQSKKLTNTKRRTGANQSSSKKKKPKTINEGDCRQIQKQLKKLIQQAPAHTKPKKRSNKLAQKTLSFFNNSCSLYNDKHLKKYSKSEEMLAHNEQKRSKEMNIEKKKYNFQKQSFSMPLTQRIVTLFSNSSSVYNSRKELQGLDKGQSFIIPTEESVQQISEIRQYQHVSLRKQHSDSLRRLKKLSPLRQKNLQNFNQQSQSTLDIVKLYLQKFKDIRQHSLSGQLQQISYIPEINQSKGHPLQQQIAQSLDLGQIHYISDQLKIKKQSSDVMKMRENPLLLKQEQQIGKLDGLIKQIQRENAQNLQEQQKQLFLIKIKQLISTSSDYDHKMLIAGQKEQTNQNNFSDLCPDLNTQLDKSLKSDQVISQLNLQVLDKALRQRQNYLIERKERQLNKLQQQPQKSFQGKNQQKTSIIKWIDCQIKQVVHTRHQLWKSFYFAKNILKNPEIQKNKQKKKKMFKCLSGKYLKNLKVDYLEVEGKKREIEITMNVKELSKKEQQEQGRIGESVFKQLEFVQFSQEQGLVQSSQVEVDIRVTSQQNQSGQLVITSQNYKQSQSCLSQFTTEKQSKNSSQLYLQNQNLNTKSKQEDLKIQFNLQSQAKQKIQGPQSVGLSLVQVECEILQQESQNQENVFVLSKGDQVQRKEALNSAFNLCVQDKEDIFEFVFLDLCIELTDQFKNDSPLMSKIYSFIRTLKEQSKKQKGFKTNSHTVKEYLYQLISFLKTKPQLLQQVHTNIDKPLGPTALDILKYMHVYDQEPVEEQQTNEAVFIMELKVFQTFQNSYLSKLEFQSYYQDEEKQKKRRAFLKNAIHIHNKAIFDALNENLDKERPFGVWGEPFQWKREAKFHHLRTPFIKNNLILKCAQKTIQSVAYMCGFMLDKQDCSFKGNTSITQSYIDQVREDRLSRMLASELQENQQKMLFIDDEQTEILVEIGHAIFQTLLAQAIKQILDLN